MGLEEIEPMSEERSLRVTTPSDHEIVLERRVDAPSDCVFCRLDKARVD